MLIVHEHACTCDFACVIVARTVLCTVAGLTFASLCHTVANSVAVPYVCTGHA